MPGKRQKLNNNSFKPSRGLDYFFEKQRQNVSLPVSTTSTGYHIPLKNNECLTDEELARKLQAEWNQEDASMGINLQDLSTNNISSISDSLPSNHNSYTRDEQTPNLEITGNYSEVHSGKSKDKVSLEINTNKTLSLQYSGNGEETLTSNIPFDENPLKFKPSKYLEELKCYLDAEEGSASYAILTRCYVLINNTSSRIKIVDTLVNFLRLLIEGDPSSLLPSVWLATNAISPPYIPLELGLGGSAISKALKNIYGLGAKSFKSIYDKLGDAGDVAFEVKKKQTYTLRKPRPLTIKEVYQSLLKIATTHGNGSAELKQKVVDHLLRNTCGAEENRFIVRMLCQHLRIGAVKTTMLIALSRAFQLSRPSGAKYNLKPIEELSTMSKDALTEVWSNGEEILKACFARRPNYNDLVPALLEVGVCDKILILCNLKLHIPLRPMLGSITRDLSEMLTKFQNRDFACEYKYDGQRAQIHCDAQGKVSIFSRHLEVMTDKYPDIVELIPKTHGEGVSDFIMEGEVVAVDPSTGELKPFQTLSNRSRKDVSIRSIKIEVCFFAFDLMYLNGEPLLRKPFRKRRGLLRSLFIEVTNKFTWAKSLDATSQDSESVLEFFSSAIESKCEGIMVKMLDDPTENFNQNDLILNSADFCRLIVKDKDSVRNSRRKALLSTYEPDKRLECWLKIKKDYSNNFDTLDLIPIAAWHGQGRKSKWWSPILFAVRNENTGSLEAVCKCISGFTDSFYKENKIFYHEDGPNVLPKKPGYIEYNGGQPDVWFEPQEVFEMAFADITQSPVYNAAIGLVSDERGLSLRFPRFLRKRTDKSIEESSTSEFLAALWRKQESRSRDNSNFRKRNSEEADVEDES